MFILDMFARKMRLPAREEALPGRSDPLPTAERHAVSGHPLKGPFADGLETAVFGLGSFRGAERLFWRVEGVRMTAAGYAGGHTPNPTHAEVSTGQTGHAEVVLVLFDPAVLSYAALVALFFESHDPTQGMRQGKDMGTPYRSCLFVASARQRETAEAARAAYRKALREAGHPGEITTEILEGSIFFYAEAIHQQYLAKTPGGASALEGTGIPFPRAALSVQADRAAAGSLRSGI